MPDDLESVVDIQQIAEDHIHRCFLALEAEDNGADPDWPDVAGPFCGCTTCIIREVLTISYDVLRR